VPGTGIEPVRSFYDRQILSLLCLPISPPGQSCLLSCVMYRMRWIQGRYYIGSLYNLAIVFLKNFLIYSVFFKLVADVASVTR
jgi:hypothetical protein